MAESNVNLSSLLSTENRDFLIRNNGEHVKIKDLTGKIVGLYFAASHVPPCLGFTTTLVEVYEELASQGDFEVVYIPLDKDVESFKAFFSNMPWLTIPFSDSATIKSVTTKLGVQGVPHLAILDGAGNVLSNDGVQLFREHEARAYPFTAERLDQLNKEEEEAKKNQSLESLLVYGSLDYVISSDGKKVLVSQLIGKYVVIYFSAAWCSPCRAFTPTLIEMYNELKAKKIGCEIIFVSRDADRASFDAYFSKMPWLTLPFGDKRTHTLHRRFKVRGIPCAVVIGPDGKTITTEGQYQIPAYGVDAFPFTEEQINKLKEPIERMAKGWPEKLKVEIHEHELVKTHIGYYYCEKCDQAGHTRSFGCDECQIDFHPKCVMKNDEEAKEENRKVENKEGYVCEGDVCRRAK